MKKYKLELTEKQVGVVAEALEFFSRFSAGQFTMFPRSLEGWTWEKWSGDEYQRRREIWEGCLNQAKMQMFDMHPNASLGIGNEELTEEAKVAYDIYRPILEQFAKESRENNPDRSWNVYDSPGLTYSKEGRVDVKIED